MGRTQVSDPEICLNQTTKVLELRTSYSETHVLIFAHDSCLVLLPLLEQLPRIYKSEGSYRRGRREEEHLRLLPTLPNIQSSTGPVSQLYLFKFRRDQPTSEMLVRSRQDGPGHSCARRRNDSISIHED